jgi:teichuronic acid biosynthesis glycosyltransferase TuaC
MINHKSFAIPVSKSMNSICVICSQYPSKLAPTSQVFVQQFVWAMADLGVECIVICPIGINLHPALIKLPQLIIEKTENGSIVKVYFPKFISFGQRNILGLKTARFTTDLYFRAIDNVWNKLEKQPEVIYGHFLTPAGISASRISRKYKVPSFAAYGESSPWSIYNYGKDSIKEEILNLNGIVAVSTANKLDLEKVNVYPNSKVRVFPNGIRTKHFYPRNKERARSKFGIDQNTFLVAYLGQFSERKGVLRVAEAVNGLESVSVAFAGKGPLQPKVSNCVYNDIVKPEDVPDFLSAADVFVLPTLNEGCCNAIVEAMACGLPVISADLPFNTDILDNKNSILIDPGNIQDIREAITYLRDNSAVCTSMSRASLDKVKSLSIESRVKNIYNWINEMK